LIFFILSFDWKTLNICAESDPSNEVEVEFFIFDIEDQISNSTLVYTNPDFLLVLYYDMCHPYL